MILQYVSCSYVTMAASEGWISATCMSVSDERQKCAKFWYQILIGKKVSGSHSSEKKVLGQLKNQEKCFKICYVYGK